MVVVGLCAECEPVLTMTDPRISVDGEVREFLQGKYPHLEIIKTVELQTQIRFLLADEGDFEGLTDFIEDIAYEFHGTVELRRESTKSFQLELLIPKVRNAHTAARAQKNKHRHSNASSWITGLAFSMVWSLLMWLLMSYVGFPAIAPRSSS